MFKLASNNTLSRRHQDPRIRAAELRGNRLVLKHDEPFSKGSVEPAELKRLLAAGDRLIVMEEPFAESRLLYESNRKEDLEALQESLIIEKPKSEFHCMCLGSPAIYVLRGDEIILEITNHHGSSVRCSLWGSDAPVVDVERWLSWFSHRGMNGPQEEVEAKKSAEEQNKKDWLKWVMAMPECFEDIWESCFYEFGEVDTQRLLKLLQDSQSQKNDQIRTLLTWFGSGAGPWSGFPAYEMVAEQLLLEYSVPDLVDAIHSDQMSPAQQEGAARLFAGWFFKRKYRRKGLAKIPNELKLDLWNYVKSTGDPEKIATVERAFAL